MEHRDHLHLVWLEVVDHSVRALHNLAYPVEVVLGHPPTRKRKVSTLLRPTRQPIDDALCVGGRVARQVVVDSRCCCADSVQWTLLLRVRTSGGPRSHLASGRHRCPPAPPRQPGGHRSHASSPPKCNRLGGCPPVGALALCSLWPAFAGLPIGRLAHGQLRTSPTAQPPSEVSPTQYTGSAGPSTTKESYERSWVRPDRE